MGCLLSRRQQQLHVATGSNGPQLKGGSHIVNYNMKNIRPFSYEGETFKCYVIDVYDGDTCTVVFSEGGRDRRYKIRLLRSTQDDYDAYEMKDKEHDMSAMAARNDLAKLIDKKMVCIKMGKMDAYPNRIHGHIFLFDGFDVNAYMYSKHHRGLDNVS